MNKIIIKGRLTHDPELRNTDSGVPVCSFDVAVNRRFDKETADFFRCTAWRKTGEIVSQYFTKGKEILLSGEMQSRKYEDKEGNKRIAWDINVDEIDFCGNKSDNVAAHSDQPAFVPDPIEGDEDLPF